MEREKLGSRLGFILLSAGCAIGVGNVWKFPYMTGAHGGGLFVLVYLIFLVVLGIPIMTMEFAIGRASRKSPVLMYKELQPQKTKWHLHGYASLGGNVILMMFYTCVTGWILHYVIKMAKGDFNNVTAEGSNELFTQMTANPGMQMIFVGIVIVIGVVVCMFGVKNSLEKVTKVTMVAMFILMIAVAISCLFLSGAAEGLKFYLIPNFEAMKEAGISIFDIITGAMSQAFFTLSLGIGSMAIFGSYLDKKRSLLGEAVSVASLDTLVALISGLIVFTACFTYNGGNVNAGPPLIFNVFPLVFSNMPLGQVWGTLFFVFLAFAALSTIFAVFENIIACIMDLTKWSRKKASIIVGIGILVLSIPCVLGFNIWAGFTPFGNGSNVLDLEDFIVSNLLLPVGSLIVVLFCTHKKGWGYENFIEEANLGKGMKVKKWMKGYLKYVLPVILTAFIIINLLSFFNVI